MTVLKQFGETGQEIGSNDIEINESNFQQYIDQYGKDRAQGYLDCFSDILKQLHTDVIMSKRDPRYGNSDQVTGRRATDFNVQKIKLLKTMLSILSDQSSDSAFDLDQKYKP